MQTLEERQRATDLSNLTDREREIDAEIGKLRRWSPTWWRKVGRAGELRTRRIELEATADPGGRKEAKMPEAKGRILILCLVHSKPGEMIAATLRKAGGDTVALCPKCMADGAAIRENLGVELTLENVSNALAETVKAAGVRTGKHGLAQSPDVTEGIKRLEQQPQPDVVQMEPTLDDIRRAHDTRRSLPPDPMPPGPPPPADPPKG